MKRCLSALCFLLSWLILPGLALGSPYALGEDGLAPDFGELSVKIADYAKSDSGTGAGWIALFEAWAELRSVEDKEAYFDERHAREQGLHDLLQELARALPEPRVWPELKALAQSRIDKSAAPNRQDLGLLLLFDVLLVDRAGIKTRLRQIADLSAAADDAQAEHSGFSVDELQSALTEELTEQDTLARFEKELAEAIAAEDSWTTLVIPDLVTLVGKARAGEILHTALVAHIGFEVPTGAETLAIAQQHALQQIELLKRPQWNLVRGADSAALFEALQERFLQRSTAAAPRERRGANATVFAILANALIPGSFRDADVAPEQATWQWELKTARLHYLLALIVHGRSEDAARVATDLDADLSDYDIKQALQAIASRGHQASMFDFLDGVLAHDPLSPFWPRFIALGAELGQETRVLERLAQAMAVESLTQAQRADLRKQRIDALYAADRVEDAAAESLAFDRIKSAVASNTESVRAHLGLRLAEVGRLLGRKEWLAQGLAMAHRAIKTKLAEGTADFSSWESKSWIAELSKLLRRVGDTDAADALLVESLGVLEKNSAKRHAWDSSMQDLLVERLGVMHDAERYADLIALLEQSKYWNAGDIAGFIDSKDSLGFPAGYLLAHALHKSAADEKAIAVLKATLARSPGFDPAYELFVDLSGATAIAELDRLYLRDRFEERPLIWKAIAQSLAGNYAAAEASAKAAIAIDPSDGEQGANHRMRVYATLAGILRAQDEMATAAVYESAVKAIRLSELADQYRLAGLLKRAIVMYQEALTLFSDAYCIQSRLAVELAGRGQMDAAEQHYRRAYELMPDSFGRVESHCFGCEDVFSGERPQAIAEQVFGKLAKTAPNKPQVHYLLGYLRKEQDRYAEALDHFRYAVSLDPLYLNAWSRLQDIVEHIHVPAAERDLIALNLLKLDPQQRHVEADFTAVVDMRALWEAAAAAQLAAPDLADAVYPLAASAERLAGVEPLASFESPWSRRKAAPQPAASVVATRRVQAVLSSISGTESTEWSDSIMHH